MVSCPSKRFDYYALDSRRNKDIYSNIILTGGFRITL